MCELSQDREKDSINTYPAIHFINFPSLPGDRLHSLEVNAGQQRESHSLLQTDLHGLLIIGIQESCI